VSESCVSGSAFAGPSTSAKATADETADKTRKSELYGEANTMKKTIMLVDDDANLTRLLKRILEKKGDYEVVIENTSTQAAKRVLEIMPDLIVLDVVMPGKDGGEVQWEIRQNERTKRIPIIILTSMVTKAESGMIAGDKFVAKPVNVNELITDIEAALNPA